MSTNATPVYFEDLELGMESELVNTVTENDIESYAVISGDRNPVHVDADYAAGTIFKERIAHGLLTAGYISAIFGMKLPGPGAIYISQTLNFKAPVTIGSQVTTRVKVVELVEGKRRARFECECLIGDKVVLDGEAVLMVPSRPKA